MDDHLYGVFKPAAVPSQPDKTGDTGLVELLGLGDVGLPHRLDRPVSGVMVLTRTAEALRGMNALFQGGLVEKVYWAVVEGRVVGLQVAEHRLVHDTRLHKARSAGPEGLGKAVRLHIKPLREGDRYTLVELRPDGGSFHQIRAQLAATGHPIKGDVKYGARRAEADRSIALHACSLAFPHPVDRHPMLLLVDPPEQGIWTAMGTAGVIDR